MGRRNETGVPAYKEELELMFLGQYHHSFDEKSRLTIPAKFREFLIDGAYVIQGFDRNVMVLSTSAFETIYKRVIAMNITEQNARALRRLILGTAFQLEMDSSGRILIPENLRNYAGLEKEAILIGQGNYFEVWSPVSWQQQENQLQDAETNAQRFSALDLSTQ